MDEILQGEPANKPRASGHDSALLLIWLFTDRKTGNQPSSRPLKPVYFLPREVGMFSAAWKMLKDTVLAFINDEALSRGAAIAFYTVTSIGPVLLIVIAIAGLAFGASAQYISASFRHRRLSRSDFV
jgi:hypothetical protein